MGNAPKRRGNKKRTAPPPVYTDTFRFLLAPEQKEWILNHGGGDYIRRLITEDRERQEAALLTDVKAGGRDTLEKLLGWRVAERKPLRITWQSEPGKIVQSSGEQTGYIRWSGPLGSQTRGTIEIGPVSGPAHYLVSVDDIQRVQEPGDNGAVLWVK